MDSEFPSALGRGTYRATITGVGRLGPIEERVGCRLVRIVDPESREGVALVRARRVSFIGPAGTALGRVDLAQARRLLELRLVGLLEDAGTGDGAEAIRDGLVRLRRSGSRVGRA
jgi:hypothetical protein